MRHHIHQIILLFILCCTSVRSAAQAPSGFDYYTKEQVEATIADENATDPVYYYIQFYDGDVVTYLAEFQGDNNETACGTKDYFPFAKNIQWRLVATETEGQFKLKSRNGYYVYYDDIGNRWDGLYRSTENPNTASTFVIDGNVSGCYRLHNVDDTDDQNRFVRRPNEIFGKDVHNWTANNDETSHTQLRFATLKENAVHIIYRDLDHGTADKDEDGVSNRHYLTYSGTDDGAYPVSARLSPAINSAASWLSPYLAANHQDGLWKLEKSEKDGEFYIQKYQGGETDYLVVKDGKGNSECLLGAKSNTAIYKIENNYANRYSRIISVNGTPNNATDGSQCLDYATNNSPNSVGQTVFFWNGTNNKWKAGFVPVDPSNIDEEKEGFQLRFSNEIANQNLFVTDMGDGQVQAKQVQDNEDDAYESNRTWYINYQGDIEDNKFTLESGHGNYVYLAENDVYQTTNDATQATTFGFKRMDKDGAYAICPYNDNGELDITKSMNYDGTTVNANEWSVNAKLEIISVSPQINNTYRIRFRDLDNGARRYFTANDAGTKVTLETYKNGEDYSRQRWTLGGDSNQNFTLSSDETGNYAGMYSIKNKSYNSYLNRSNSNEDGTQLFTTEKTNATPFKLSILKGEWGTYHVEINLDDDAFSEYSTSKALAHLNDYKDGDKEGNQIARWDSQDGQYIMFVYDPLPLPDPDTEYPGELEDAEYFYLRFSDETTNQNLFVTDMGEEWTLKTNAEDRYENGRKWQIVYQDGTDNQFILKSGFGNYIYLDGENFKTTNDATQATKFGFKRMDMNGSYAICPYIDGELDITKSMNCADMDATVNASGQSNNAKLEIISVKPQIDNTYRIRFRDLNNKERLYFTANEINTKVTLETYGNGMDYSSQRWKINGSYDKFHLSSEEGDYYAYYPTDGESTYGNKGPMLSTTGDINNVTHFTLQENPGEEGDGIFSIKEFDNENGGYNELTHAGSFSLNSIPLWQNQPENRVMFIYDPLPNAEYFYLRFSDETTYQNLFVTDMGEGQTMRTSADVANENGRHWQIIYQGDVANNMFILASGSGNYARLDGTNFNTTKDAKEATTFGFKRMDNEGSYAICPYIDGKLDIDQCMNYNSTAVNASGWSDKAKLEIISVSPQPANGYTYRIRFRDLDKNNNYARRYFTANDADKKVTLETYKNKMDYSRQRWTLSGDSNQNFTLRSEAGNYAGMYSIKEKTYNNNLNRSNSNDEGTQLFTTTEKTNATPFKLSYFEGEWGTYNVEINLPDEAFFNFNNEPGKALAHLKDYKDGDKEGNQIARWEHEDASRIMFVYDPLPEYFYLRFVGETTNQNVFVTDMGKGEQMKTNLTGTYGNGSKWQIIYQAKNTLEEQIEANQFILKSGLGNYVYFDGENFKTTSERDKASTLCFLYSGMKVNDGDSVDDKVKNDGGSYVICDYDTYKKANAEDKPNPKGCMNSKGGVYNGTDVIAYYWNDNGCPLEIISLDPQTGSTYHIRFAVDSDLRYWAGYSTDKKIERRKGTDDDQLIDSWHWTIDGNNITEFKLKTAKFGHYLDYRNTAVSEPNEGLDNNNARAYNSLEADNAMTFNLKPSTSTQHVGSSVLEMPEVTGDYKFVNKRDNGIGLWNGGDGDQNNRIFFVFDPMAYFPNNYLRDAVDYEIIHKESYLRGNYYKGGKTDVKESTGLAQDKDSDWKTPDNKQKTNEFRISHYVRKGEVMKVGLPNEFWGNNCMTYYLRWYTKDDKNARALFDYDYENTQDLFKHAYFDLNNRGRLQGYEYKNGFVTGEEIYYDPAQTVPDFHRSTRHVNSYFYYTNPDGKDCTIFADVSRYSDYTYQNTDAPLNGYLEEPTLSMRYIYEFKDAKEMAEKLTKCTGDKWLEEKTIHFPQYNLPYEDKKNSFKGEFISMTHEFRDYWVFNGGGNDENLRNFECDGNSIEMEFEGDADGSLKEKRELKSEGPRFIHFSYPTDGYIPADDCDKPNVIKVYLNDNGTRYQVAKFTIIFDKGGQTIPWKSGTPDGYTLKDDGTLEGGTLNGRMPSVSGTYRDPNKLRKEYGTPIAKVTFDYPKDAEYTTPSKGKTYMGNKIIDENSADPTACPLPLKFDNTSYSYANSDAEWGSYAILKQQTTLWGLNNPLMPSNDETYGTGIKPDDGLQRGFMYIDASERPGSICTIPFQGSFCPEDELTCSGWISGANNATEDVCPGSAILTVKGSRNGVTYDIYCYCPGQVAELSTDYTVGGEYADGENSQWQQFFFTFRIDKYYDEYWLEVNNNCVNSHGGDFMLDDIEIYAPIPVVAPELNTPRCVESNNETDNESDNESDNETVMDLLKLSVSFEKLLMAKELEEVEGDEDGDTHFLDVAFLDRDLFLKTFRDNVEDEEIKKLTLDSIEVKLLSGDYERKELSAYEKAFNDALLGGKPEVWDSTKPDQDTGNSLLKYGWNTNFEKMPEFKFADAVGRTAPVYRGTNSKTGEREVIINGNYTGLPWKENTQYYIVTNDKDDDDESYINKFDLRSPCTRVSKYTLKPSYKILGDDVHANENEDEYQVCEGKTITITTNLSGYTINGETVQLEDLNYDWWLGDIVRNEDGTVDEETIPTLENFYKYKRTINGEDVYLSQTLSHYRMAYPETSPSTSEELNVICEITPAKEVEKLSDAEKELLKELIDEGKLNMGCRSLTTDAFQQQMIDEDSNIWAFYLVACPILDATLMDHLDYLTSGEPSIYVCDNPQQLKIRLEGVSPSLNSGFVDGANGNPKYNYRPNLSTLSVRMANEQFETLLHSSDPEKGITLDENRGEDDNLLFLPVRDAKVGMTDGNATGVISKAGDDNVYLSASTDPDWNREIQKCITDPNNGLPPIVGKVVDLQAIDTERVKGTNADADNRLVIYFYGDGENGVYKFDVREGYNYTLKVPYQENNGENKCDNALLIDLKIVPDYEVWTGGAGNTDWNNDENWRRADYGELYANKGDLEDYISNRNNYRYGIGQALRKGFAPLYCTRVLMMNTEWGNAPKLYDALDSENNTTKTLVNAPFPNLRDQDDWDGEGAAATASEIIKFDMQVRSKAKWSEIYEEKPTLALDNTIYDGDLFAEMYQPNTCNEIAFQAGTELLNAHLLNYNTAWVEHELNLNRWYLMGSSLQGTIAGEWYAPTENAKQQTTYFAPVTFGAGYDRFSPAFYQRGWDKAKTVLYQVESEYSTGDASEDNLGNPYGLNEKDSVVKDEYLYRLGYRWLGTNKGNVAIKGTWSNTYNDVTVDYSTGGFTVKALNNLKGNDSEGTTIVRLPKEDTKYNYYGFDNTTGGTETQIDSIQTKLDRAKNRGRLKTDLLLPTDDGKMWLPDENATYGSRQISRVPTTEDGVTSMNGKMNTITEALPAGQSNLGFYLVGNPFQTGLDMDKFFAEEKNNENLEKKFWIMTANGQMLTVKDVLTENWITQKSEAGSETFEATNAVVAPGQGFFVQATNKDEFDGKVYFTRDMQARTRNGKMSGTGTPYTIVVGTKQKQAYDGETPLFTNGEAAYDENGKLVKDEYGNVMVHPHVEEGAIDYDALKVGEPQLVYEEDGTTPVMEEITDNIIIHKYVEDTEQPNYTLRARQRQSPTPSAQFTITAKSGTQQSSALLTLSEQSSNEFMPAEDTELFMADELATAPYVYTLCGHLATVVNRLHDFRSIPIGLENAQPGQQTTLRFNGVEALGDSVTIYDALTEETIELQEGTELAVKGNTLGRYFLVRGGISEESVESVREISITHKGSQVTVTSTADALLNVRAYSTDGKLLHSANPGTPDYTFTLPSASGPIIIEASTAESSKTKKLLIH